MVHFCLLFCLHAHDLYALQLDFPKKHCSWVARFWKTVWRQDITISDATVFYVVYAVHKGFTLSFMELRAVQYRSFCRSIIPCSPTIKPIPLTCAHNNKNSNKKTQKRKETKDTLLKKVKDVKGNEIVVGTQWAFFSSAGSVFFFFFFFSPQTDSNYAAVSPRGEQSVGGCERRAQKCWLLMAPLHLPRHSLRCSMCDARAA